LRRRLYQSSFSPAKALRAAVGACHGEASTGVVGSRITAMNDNEPTIEQRIKVLEAAAQKARLEAIDVAGRLLARTLPYPNYVDGFAALQMRYAALTKIAIEAQAVIDRLLAESAQHEAR
jgi:hypothetical protein